MGTGVKAMPSQGLARLVPSTQQGLNPVPDLSGCPGSTVTDKPADHAPDSRSKSLIVAGRSVRCRIVSVTSPAPNQHDGRHPRRLPRSPSESFPTIHALPTRSLGTTSGWCWPAVGCFEHRPWTAWGFVHHFLGRSRWPVSRAFEDALTAPAADRAPVADGLWIRGAR